MRWRKSSFTGDANCVEVGWRKSSFSAGDSNCVEMAWPGGAVAIRDSKSPVSQLDLPAGAFARLLSAVKEC